jgi:hypothetical protein
MSSASRPSPTLNSPRPSKSLATIVYRISERGKDLMTRMATLVQEYRDGNRSDMQSTLGLLEDKLAAGELDEDAYLKQRKTIEARYAKFVEEAKPG